MLNFEQILIKAAQYLDLELSQLKIKGTPQKTRFVNKSSSQEKYEEVLSLLLKELGSRANNKVIKIILDEFFKHYEYLTHKLQNSCTSKNEISYDWLLLRFFVVPFFAVRISQNFSNYYHRADLGLPGGYFWYLPRHSKVYGEDRDKIIYPVNEVMKWWIDLSGMSNDDFYHQFLEVDNSKNSIKNGQHTLKKWHDTGTLPSHEKIAEYASCELMYEGIFTPDKNVSISKQFTSALDFLKRKKLTHDQLKNEIPNTDNIIERLDDDLSDKDKKKFVAYIAKRWKKPSARRLRQVLTVARASQALYIDLCKSFVVDKKCTNISENRVLQLSYLFSTLYNVQMLNDDFNETDYEAIEVEKETLMYGDYLQPMNRVNSKQHEVLDRLAIEIKRLQDSHFYNIPQIIYLLTQDKNEIQKLFDIASLELNTKSMIKKEAQKAYKVTTMISTSTDLTEAKKYIDGISNYNVLNMLGDYYTGDNYLTIRPPVQWLDLAIYIYSVCVEKAKDKKTALIKVASMATNPHYPRLMNKEGIEYILNLLIQEVDEEDLKEYLQFKTIYAYFIICQQDTTEIAKALTNYLEFTHDFKSETYDFNLLRIGVEILPKGKYKKLIQLLKERIALLDPSYIRFYEIQNIYYF